MISAFVPARTIGGFLQWQGVVLFVLDVMGIASAIAAAWSIQRLARGEHRLRPLMMEMPAWHRPVPRQVVIGLWQRVMIFLRRVGSIILTLTMLLWLLASVPGPPVNYDPATRLDRRWH